MAIYIDRQLQITVSKNANLTDPVMQRGSTVTKIKEQTHLAEVVSGSIVVPAPSTNLQLSISPGITTGRAFYLESDQNLTVKFGGTEDDRALTLKVPETSKLATMYLEIEFDSVYVTLGGTTDANIYYAAIGA